MTLRSAVVVLCVMFGTVVLVNAFYVLPRLSEQVKENTRSSVALCALRLDLQRRVDGSVKFLAEHPNGFSGVSPRTIQDGIDNQTRTISALRVLECPPIQQ